MKKIERGIVIDHLPAGSCLKVLATLGINEKYPGTVSVMMNTPSSRFGLKDIIKLEGKELSRQELEKAALSAPYATVNVIRDYAIAEKFKLRLPKELVGIVKCPNSACITNREGTAKLFVEEQDPLRCRCAYCEKVFGAAELHVAGQKVISAFA